MPIARMGTKKVSILLLVLLCLRTFKHRLIGHIYILLMDRLMTQEKEKEWGLKWAANCSI